MPVAFILGRTEMVHGNIASLTDGFECDCSANPCCAVGYGGGFAFEEIPGGQGHCNVVDRELLYR